MLAARFIRSGAVALALSMGLWAWLSGGTSKHAEQVVPVSMTGAAYQPPGDEPYEPPIATTTTLPPTTTEPPTTSPPAPTSGCCGPHSDAWWHGVAICEQGGRNDPYFGYFSFMDGSQGGKPWDEQVAAGNALLARAGREIGPWAESCVRAGYAASPNG